jgi:hypothetical protein
MAVHFGFTQHMSDIIPWQVIDGDEVNSGGPIMERTRMKYNSFIVIKKQSAFADCSVCRQKGDSKWSHPEPCKELVIFIFSLIIHNFNPKNSLENRK